MHVLSSPKKLECTARFLNQILGRLSYWALPALLFSLVFSLGVINYSIPRGFDITDESLSVLLTQPGPDISFSVIHTQLIFQQIHSITGWSFGYQQLRGIRLLLTLSVFVFLGYTLFNEKRKDTKTLWLFGGAATSLLLYTAVGHIHTLGYNVLNWNLGALLLATAIQWTRPGNATWKPFAMGIQLYLIWITKFPSALLLAALTMVLLPAGIKMPLKKWIVSLAVTASCFISLLWLTRTVGHPIYPLDFLSFVKAETTGSHTANSVLPFSLNEFAIHYGLLLPFLLLGKYIRPKATQLGCTIRYTLPLVIISLSIIEWLVLKRQYNDAHWILTGGLAALNIMRCTNRRLQIIGILLVLTPAALTIGTNVPWRHHLLPLSCFALLSAGLTSSDRSSWIAALAIPILVFSELILHTYRQAPLSQCTENITITRTGESIIISPILHEYLSETRRITKQYPFPLVGTDRNCGEAMMTSAPNEGELLWSLESWNTRHTQSWNQHDTLLIALCNVNDQEFLEAQLPAHQWTFLDKVDRRPILKEMERYKREIPEQNAFAVYYLLTRTDDR